MTRLTLPLPLENHTCQECGRLLCATRRSLERLPIGNPDERSVGFPDVATRWPRRSGWDPIIGPSGPFDYGWVGIVLRKPDDPIDRYRSATRRLEQALRSGGICPWAGDHTGVELPGLVDSHYPGSGDRSGVSWAGLFSDRWTLEPLRHGSGSMPVFWPDPTERHDWRGFQPLAPGQVGHGGGAPWTPTQFVANGPRPDSPDDPHVFDDVDGWYPDPCHTAPFRYFTGVEWTHWVSDGATAQPTGPLLTPLISRTGELDSELGLRAGVALLDFAAKVVEYLGDDR